MLVGPKAEVIEMYSTFWNADIVALATGLFTDKKCCLDTLRVIQGKRAMFLSRQVERPFSMVSFWLVLGFCCLFRWFQRINLTKGHGGERDSRVIIKLE